jgi:hypothetical protein
MLVISENTIQIPHIIWQPSFQCSGQCKGCYIYSAPINREKIETRTEILDLLFNKNEDHKSIQCEQFTISLDSFINQPDPILVNALIKLWNNKPVEQLCVTLQNYNSLLKWAQIMKRSVEDFIKPLSFLSLSSMPAQGKTALELSELCHKHITVLIYNRVIKESVKESKAFEIGCRYARMVYLVLFKPPLGQQLNPNALYWLTEAYALAEEYNNDCSGVVLDKCVTDCNKYLTTNHTCSAGLDRITVWPNNQITSCQYDTSNLYQTTIINSNALWNDINEIINSKNHPIKRCKIPELINPQFINTTQQSFLEKQCC